MDPDLRDRLHQDAALSAVHEALQRELAEGEAGFLEALRAEHDAPELRTARLVLRPARLRDIHAMIAFYRDNRAHLQPWGPPIGPELLTVRWWVARLAENERERVDGRSLKLILRREEAGEVLGTISLFDIKRGCAQSAMLGYALAEAAQGKGYVTEAGEAVIAYAFAELRLHRIWTAHDPENHRSARVLARLGFEVEGTLRRSFFTRGAWRDETLVARLAPDDEPPPGA